MIKNINGHRYTVMIKRKNVIQFLSDTKMNMTPRTNAHTTTTKQIMILIADKSMHFGIKKRFRRSLTWSESTSIYRDSTWQHLGLYLQDIKREKLSKDQSNISPKYGIN
jgi:hypothetical protein